MAVSSEKIALLTTLAEEFNNSDAEVDGSCIFVRPRSVSSGRAAELIPEGWPSPDVNGEPPVIWSPAASGWAGIVNERAGTTLAPAGTPFMLTPLVIAMPEPMAEALGWPEESIGFADLQSLATNPEGWAAVGAPEWGPFRIGKTNPNFSTSGLNFTIAEYYAATGKSADLTIEDLSRPAAVEFATDIESSVVHYGDITMTFLNNWFAADARGTSLTYASAVAVEEKSVIDYNRGDPDGVLAPGEELRPPRVPARGDLPGGRDAVLGQPLHHPRHRVGRRQRAGRRPTIRSLRPAPREPGAGARLRIPPEQPRRRPRRPDHAGQRRRPDPAAVGARSAATRVLVAILDSWAELRKEARVLLVLDVSGSMGEFAGADNETKLDLAKSAALSSLDEFKDTDEVGLWVFSTDLGGEHPNWREVVPVGEIGANRDDIAAAIERQIPVQGTPLYEVTGVAYETMLEQYDPSMINAVVLLTDGVNDDGIPSDDDDQFTELIETLQAGQRRGHLATGARVHDLLRRVSRRDHAAGDQPGDERSHLQRQQPADHRASLHRRHLELLTMSRILATRGGSPRGALRDPPSVMVGSGFAGPTISDWVRPQAAPTESSTERRERAKRANE